MEPTFQGETQFLAWGDGPSGPWVKLLLPESDDLAPFRGMTSAKKGMAGQRLACVLVEIGDDEQPVLPEPLKGGALAKLAGQFCGERTFQDWLATIYTEQVEKYSANTIDDEAIAAKVVRELCGVKSRAELDHNAEAARKFQEFIRKPYMKAAKDL